MSFLKKTMDRVMGQQLPIRQRFFNIIFICGFLMGISGVFACISLNSSREAITVSAAMTFILPLLAIIGITSKQKQDVIIAIAVTSLNFVIFPLLYLTGGGIYCGIPGYFIIGLALTPFLIKGKAGTILMTVETAFYLFIFFISYKFPNLLSVVPACETEAGLHEFIFSAKSSNAAMVCIAIALLTKILFRMYKNESLIVARSIEEIKRQSTIDPLTNVYNRRYMYNYLTEQVEYAKSNNKPLSIVIFDIDKFKDLNDTYGHLLGDDVLKAVCNILKSACRDTEIISRYGGEEFLLILPGSDATMAKSRAEEIRKCIEESHLSPDLPKDNPVTISGGVATMEADSTEESLVALADQNLYTAKETGRNRICN